MLMHGILIADYLVSAVPAKRSVSVLVSVHVPTTCVSRRWP